ncbi:uncharacterized protein LOC112965403 [Apteryx rowi]|uniref:uncharacterized protein LOC112965403 n=1 Tax=Apteryx rowi TaxID=308060 RepID=UPI000E1DB201|nr:uncharacterized protein LOC112965403 [Apteryx rowi]
MKILLATSFLPMLFLVWPPMSETLYALCSDCGSEEETAEISDLIVYQTSGPISQSEGSNVTVECVFEMPSTHLATRVEWYKQNELVAEGQSNCQTLSPGKNSANLTLTNVRVADTGTYVCVVLIAGRNLTGRGNGTQVTVFTRDPEAPQTDAPGQDTQAGLGLFLYAMLGVAVGVFFSLPALCVVVWQCKTSTKGKLEKREVTEMNQLSTPPLASQTDEVTYADLNFKKEETKPASDVVYAEVKPWQKSREENTSATYAEVNVFR